MHYDVTAGFMHVSAAIGWKYLLEWAGEVAHDPRRTSCISHNLSARTLERWKGLLEWARMLDTRPPAYSSWMASFDPGLEGSQLDISISCERLFLIDRRLQSRPTLAKCHVQSLLLAGTASMSTSQIRKVVDVMDRRSNRRR